MTNKYERDPEYTLDNPVNRHGYLRGLQDARIIIQNEITRIKQQYEGKK